MLLFNTVLEKLKDSMQNYRMADTEQEKNKHIDSMENYVDLLLDSEDIDLMLRKNMLNSLPVTSNSSSRISYQEDNIALLSASGSIETNPKKVGVVESITQDFINQSQR